MTSENHSHYERPLRILVIEDDSLVVQTFSRLLANEHFKIFPDLGKFFLSPVSAESWDLILLDLRNPTDPTGKETIAKISSLKTRYPDAELVVQSGIGDVETMRTAVKNGASRFLLKDHLVDEIPALIGWQKEYKKQREILDKTLQGESEVIQRLKRDLLCLRFENQMNVLVEGETGTGKELCARALHSSGPFVGVNVSAIPTELFEAEFFGAEKGAYTGSNQSRMGSFETAGDGVLFLDEIQSLALVQQAKLLRVLETRTFSRVGSQTERPLRARIISASNQNLKELVARGKFREDLYFRLAPLSIQVPPLRIRGKDVSTLAKFFLKTADTSGKKSFTPDALQFLAEGYDWPGNVRELKGVVAQLVVRTPIPFLDTPEIKECLGISGQTNGKSAEDTFIENLRAESKTSTEVSTAPSGAGSSFQVDFKAGFDDNIKALEKYLLETSLKKYRPGLAREKLQMARSRFYEKIKEFGLAHHKPE